MYSNISKLLNSSYFYQIYELFLDLFKIIKNCLNLSISYLNNLLLMVGVNIYKLFGIEFILSSCFGVRLKMVLVILIFKYSLFYREDRYLALVENLALNSKFNCIELELIFLKNLISDSIVIKSQRIKCKILRKFDFKYSTNVTNYFLHPNVNIKMKTSLDYSNNKIITRSFLFDFFKFQSLITFEFINNSNKYKISRCKNFIFNNWDNEIKFLRMRNHSSDKIIKLKFLIVKNEILKSSRNRIKYNFLKILFSLKNFKKITYWKIGYLLQIPKNLTKIIVIFLVSNYLNMFNLKLNDKTQELIVQNNSTILRNFNGLNCLIHCNYRNFFSGIYMKLCF
ncbi:hypothetical protein (nucleomorph) [Guillardia theta]|uniref:Uncharacterized protein n=1 Tax=Guillardia theta TaxID=55529 RepID=Q98S53_GUITH|nr:hypothetical protein GTHECHR3085 [Guillardia theta]AAK39729.1 hypothetical protein [Guillardia theta]